MKLLFLSIAILLISQTANSQFNFEYNNSIVVKKNGDTLKFPWAGGLSYAQFSDVDFDFDGDMDLFVFDRSSDNIRVYIQKETAGVKYYDLDYNAAASFPNDVRYRATMVDYNQDGKNDLFCYGIGGIKVYKNVGDAINGIQWEVAKDLLYSDNWGADLNLYVSSADIPAIVDVDGDSDIDVLTYHIGGQHLQYHKNMSMENYGVPDSLEFVLMNECWGKFREDVNTNSLFLNDNTPPCAEGNVPNAESPTQNPNLEKLKPTEQTPKHAGSTVLALDYDNDGVKDLILGDVSFGNLNLLINGGTNVNTNSAMISVDPLFPSNSTPINLEVFPAGYYVDVDFDGVKDLIVGANAKNVSENETSILFYKNTGTNTLPNFIFQTNAFLQEQMIEHGTGATPVLVDLDNDGKKDLFVSNFFRHLPLQLREGSVAFYKNTGTVNDPVFTFIDYNFLNLNQSGFGLKMHPTFGDLNGDGLKDLILGLENGSLVYLENTSSLPSISFASPVINYTDDQGTIISAGSYAAPQLFDLNNDGLLDLIVGKKTGELLYYQNVGSASSPSFQLVNNLLGNIDIATTSPEGYPTPHFFRVNTTTHLFLGGVNGNLMYYNDIDANITSGSSFNLVSGNYLGIQVGAYSTFYVDDIDNDGNLNLFVGQDLGGVFHLEHNPSGSSSIQENTKTYLVSVYPNPSKDLIQIVTEFEGELEMSMYDMLGQEIISATAFNGATSINLSDLPHGIYILQFDDKNGNSVIKRIVKN